MMIDRQALVELISKLIFKLDNAEPCSIHGRIELVICLECQETVHCDACNSRSCQCWNDE